MDPHFARLAFPLEGKSPALDFDSEGFKAFDLSRECPIPMAGRGHPGAFAHPRKHHIHEGVDLYGQEGDWALALFDGEVVFNGPFTGPAAGTPHWLDTGAVAIEGEFGVLFHGEIDPLPFPLGAKVNAGDRLGRLKRVLRNDKGRPLHMLHLELYERGVRQSVGVWPVDSPRPAGLLDPTDLILASANIPGR